MSKHLITTQGINYINNCYLPTSAQPGTVWFDSASQTMKVFDGSIWCDYTPVETSLSWDAEQAIDHIIAKMNENKEIARMTAKYPIVADAMNQLEVALKVCQDLDDEE